MRSAALPVTLLCAAVLAGQEPPQPRRLTLDEAVSLALQQNSYLKIARAKVRETEGRRRSARSLFFPQITEEASGIGLAERQQIDLPRGAFGVYPGPGPIPGQTIRVLQGSNALFLSQTTVGQPLTQLFRIREGYRIAQIDTALAETEVDKAEHEIAVRVHEAYFGALIAQRQRDAAVRRVAAAEEQLRDARNAVETGAALDVARLGRQAALLESRHALLAAENQIADASAELADLAGLPPDHPLTLVEFAGPAVEKIELAAALRTALARNPDVRAAEQTERKARHGLAAARAEYIPDLGAFGQYVYQNGVPFLANNNGIFGLRLNWNLFDWGKRSGVVGERRAQVDQAEENLRRIRNRVSLDVAKAWRKLDRSREMAEVAGAALDLRREGERIARDQVEAGTALEAALRESSAATAKAEADLLAATLGYRLALAEFRRYLGLRNGEALP